ncbi:MAG: DUF6029 family protein [bacterium]
MKNRFLVFLLRIVLLSVAICCEASEGDLKISGFGDLLGIVNTDYGVSVVDGRLDLQFHLSPVTIGIDYRSYDFGEGRYNPAGIDRFHGIKHRYAEVRLENFSIVAGHSGVTFGRGLSLRSLEDRQLEYDNLVDGVLLEFSNWGFSLEPIGGAVDERISRIQSVQHRIRGLRLSRGFATAFELGLCSIERSSIRKEEGRDLPPAIANFEDRLSGADFSFRHANFSIVGDYVIREGDSYRNRTRDIDGHGFYGSAAIFLEGISLFGEYKDYSDFDHALSMGPTCIKEHPWSLMSRIIHEPNYYDEKGFLFEVMTSVDGMHLSGGASESRKHNNKLNHWEIFSEIEISEKLPIRAIGLSFSREYTTFEETWTFTEYISAASRIGIMPIGRSCFIDAEIQRVREPFRDRFFNYLLSTTFYPKDLISGAVRFEATEEPWAERDVWILGEMRIQFGDQGELGLAAGSEPGGKKCSGGICYIQPEFAGVRIRYSRYF